MHLFDALDFLAQLTQHIPPKHLQLIRGYGVYASRIKSRWDQTPCAAERAPGGWRSSHPNPLPDPNASGLEPLNDGEEVSLDARKQAWARLLAKVYEVDSLVCPMCGAQMEVVAILEGPVEIRRILSHLLKVGRVPPGFDPAVLN